MRSFSVDTGFTASAAIEVIGSDEQLLMIINELLLNGPINRSTWAFILGVLG
jgi:hypothetical protein